MKKITKCIITLIVVGLLGSCSDDSSTPTPEQTPVNNNFSMAGVDYNTSHCYFYVSYGAPYKDLFTVFLLNEEMYHNSNGAAFYTDNTDYVLTLRNFVSSNLVPTINDVIMDGVYHPSTGGQTGPLLIYDINDWVGQGNHSGRDLGHPTTIRNNGASTNSFVHPDQTDPGNFTISNLVIDHTTMTGTIDLTYSVLGDNGEVIEGTYSGAFTIISGGT